MKIILQFIMKLLETILQSKKKIVESKWIVKEVDLWWFEIEYNKNALFTTLNQGKKKFTHWACPVFAPAINLKYNCNIKLEEKDIDIILKQMQLNWKRDPKKWARWSDWVKYVMNYLKANKKRLWIKKLPKVIRFTNKKPWNLQEYIKKWYAVLIGIWVSKRFVSDARDWKIEDFNDYKNYKWTSLRHFTNLCRWTWRGTFTEDKHHDFILDSYSFNVKWNEWLYECNWKEVLEDIAYNTKYLFINN